MRSYTVHRRRRTLGNPNAEADATVFVREGFSWLALLSPALWALYHRLWLVLLGFVVAVIGINLVITAAGFPEAANTVVSVAIHVLFAAEAQDFRRWTLTRRGYDVTSVVVAKNLDEAESRYFRGWCEAVNTHQAAHAAGDNVEISFRSQKTGPATTTTRGEAPA
ncbi:MAG: DUF2628 domain-containing protein [Rhizobiales bacterium]|nr:DUF2628 domain-containing protein [Hyphomicrobiales bacterium]